jgi:hypothetical protein
MDDELMSPREVEEIEAMDRMTLAELDAYEAEAS